MNISERLMKMSGENDGDGGTSWMYNPNGDVNHEEYLLGKKIGKNFDSQGTMGQINAVEYDVAPPSIFSSQAEHQVDLQRKLMEDPLINIKKREMEDRKRLMDNPVKMKALKEHIQELKEKKKKKKKKKKRRNSDSDDDDLDIKLLQKIQAMEGTLTGENKSGNDEQRSNTSHRRGSPKDERGGRSPDFQSNGRTSPNSTHIRRISKSPPRRRISSSPPRGRRSPSEPRRNISPPRRRRSPSSPPRKRKSPSPAPRRRRSPSPPPRRRRSPSSPSKRRKSPCSPSRRRRSPNSPPKRRKSPGSPPRHKRQPRSPSGSPPRKKNKSPVKHRNTFSKRPDVADTKLEDNQTKETKSGNGPPAKSKMSDEDKQAKLAEMMANASWREDQRSQRVQKYREGQAKEDEEAKRDHDPSFMNRELKRAQESLTVEGRITANKYKIQRGVGDMDKNFARR